MRIKDFVANYVAHNSTITIYNQKRVETCECWYDEYIPLWTGMDWQIEGNPEDIKYCQERGFEICPYENEDIVRIINLPHEDRVDCIDIIIGDLIKIKEANNEH